MLGAVLASSRVHVVVLAGDDAIDRFCRPVHRCFAAWINARERRLGPVFAGRPNILAIDDASVLALVAYVHADPGRAGVVTDAVASRWTCHRAYCGLDAALGWLDVAAGLRLPAIVHARAGADGGARVAPASWSVTRTAARTAPSRPSAIGGDASRPSNQRAREGSNFQPPDP